MIVERRSPSESPHHSTFRLLRRFVVNSSPPLSEISTAGMRAVGKSNESLFHLRRDGTLRGRDATLPVSISVVISEAMASSIATHAREGVASERATHACRLGLTPARGDAGGRRASRAAR